MYGSALTASAQTETYPKIVSVASDGTQGNGQSRPFDGVAISGDGRYVAFSSDASNLVPGDTNGVSDVFVHDRMTGETTRVSVASDGAEGNGQAGVPTISADGRYVAFSSQASNLVLNDTNNNKDVFVHDRTTGETARVSVNTTGEEGNGISETYSSSISADGRFVSFYSYASNLVPQDTNGSLDTFIHDRATGQTARVSVTSDGTEGNDESDVSSLSADGRYVAFSSKASNLVPNDTNDTWDIFVHDRSTGETTRVSMASDGAEGNDSSYLDSISADGRYVAFVSSASNLAPNDTTHNWDVFVHDRTTGETTRVSAASNGAEGNGSIDMSSTAISGDGRYVAFVSSGSNLVPDDTNHTWDTFVHDRSTGQIARVSAASDGTEGNGTSYTPSLSADGRYIAFASAATNLVPNDTNGASDVFVAENPLTTSPTLGEQAAALAKELVDQPKGYLWGGKGWDYDLKEFTSSDRVLSGYSRYDWAASATTSSIGVDCSGLVLWAYNRAFDKTAYFTDNFIKYANADGQYRDQQSSSVEESELEPGDTLYFDWNLDGFVDHTAMYVGESGGYDTVEAKSPVKGIVSAFASTSELIAGFLAFRRPHQGTIDMQVTTGSPVNLTVTDPAGNTITADTVIPSDEEYLREIPGELYYAESKQGHDGKPMDMVYAPTLKEGNYRIVVIPDADALPTDTYSLNFTANGSTTVLADGAPISSIPTDGLMVQVASGTVSAVIYPDTVAPTTPAQPVATSSTSTVTLAWPAATDEGSEVAHYTVYRNGTAVGTTSNTTYTDTGLTPSTVYSYTVTATDNAGNESAQSPTLSVTTTAVPMRVSISSSASSVASGTSATLTWNVSGYTTCTKSGGWSGALTEFSGSLSVTPTTTTTYKLTCSAGSSTASASATVGVGSGGSGGGWPWF